MITPGSIFIDKDVRYMGRQLKVVSVASRQEYPLQDDVAFCVVFGCGGHKATTIAASRLLDKTRYSLKENA